MQATVPPKLVQPPRIWSNVRSVDKVAGLSQEEKVALRVSEVFISKATRISDPLRPVEVITFSQAETP